MDISQKLTDNIMRLKSNIKDINCKTHGLVKSTTKGTCFKCRDEEQIDLDFINLLDRNKEKCGIPANSIYSNASFDTYYPSCQPALDFKNQLMDYKYDKNILLCGTTGTGKTHLATALVNKSLAMGKKAYYTHFSQVNNLQINSAGEFYYLLKCDFLVLDEYGLYNTDYKKEVLMDIIEMRNFWGNKWTMLITNLDAEVFKNNIHHAAYSRLKQNVLAITDIKWQDYRIKIA